MANISAEENNKNNSLVTKKILLVSEDENFIECITALEKLIAYEVLVVSEVAAIQIIHAQESVPNLTIYDIDWLEKYPDKNVFELNAAFNIPMLVAVDTFENAYLAVLLQRDVLNCMHKQSSCVQWSQHIQWTMTIESTLRQFELQAAQLQNALKQERDINVAIGVAMVEWRVGRKESFERLRKQARDSRQKMSKICKDFLDTYEAKIQQYHRASLAKRDKVN